MEKKDIYIIAAAIALGIGMRLLRSYLARRKKKSESDKEGQPSVNSESDKDGGYEPYSGK